MHREISNGISKIGEAKKKKREVNKNVHTIMIFLINLRVD